MTDFDWRAACMDAERRFKEQQARTAEVAEMCRETTNNLLRERNNWKLAAVSLATQLGKAEYAEAEYEDINEREQ